MAEHDRPTVAVADMTATIDEHPPAGAKVWALQHGGCVVATVVTSEFAKFYDAWYFYLKVPQRVKDLQLARLM